MNKVPDPLDHLITRLHSDGRLRVWSLVITVFGDAIQPRGGRVSSVRLQDILGRMRIESGALRTAMSRLTKEGWVAREREGRRTFYRLSARGIAEFEPATRRIYAPASQDDIQQWVMGLGAARARCEAAVRASGGHVLGGGYVWPRQTAPSVSWFRAHEILPVSGSLGEVPGWVTRALALDKTQVAFEALMADFGGVQVADLPPLDAFVTRVLLVHRWRRIVLRAPELPKPVQPEGWPSGACHDFVATCYRHLMPASDHWLSAPLAGGITALPEPDVSYFTRFGQSSR